MSELSDPWERTRQWIATTSPCASTDWKDCNTEALGNELRCKVVNLSKEGEDFGTLRLHFINQISAGQIRKRMPNGINTLKPLHAHVGELDVNKFKKQKVREVEEDICQRNAETQTDNPAHVNIIEMIKAQNAKIALLEEENRKLRDSKDLSYIASYFNM
jgi:hypothetical protein